MKNSIIVIAAVLIHCHSFFPQSSSTKFDVFPDGLNFTPPKANNQEANLGVLYYTSTTNLKVDIGNSVDLIALELRDNSIKFAAGIEFMTYAFSKSYAGQRLQISAVDGFFGGNISFSKFSANQTFSARFRIIHNSAHLVDGSYNTSTDTWTDGRRPIPFTKDFGELIAAHQILFNSFSVRYYGGISYAALIRPADLKRFNYLLGVEIVNSDLSDKFLGTDINFFLAEHFFLDGTEKYFGSQQLMGGVKIGKWVEKGVVFYTSYYTGRNMFSSYYDRRISKFGIGFLVDFY